MTGEQILERYDGSWMLGVLRLCGWQVRSIDAAATRLVARRADVELSVEQPSSEAAITAIFIEAMRGHPDHQHDPAVALGPVRVTA
jgi:acetolactate synthase regulatory subunit